MIPGSPEWHARINRMLVEESKLPKRWFYISFAGPKFLGAVFVEAQGPATVTRRTHELGINPGGEALTIELTEENALPPPEMRNRLLSKAELEAWTPIERVET